MLGGPAHWLAPAVAPTNSKYEAKPSLSHSSPQKSVVTRLPNHCRGEYQEGEPGVAVLRTLRLRRAQQHRGLQLGQLRQQAQRGSS